MSGVRATTSAVGSGVIGRTYPRLHASAVHLLSRSPIPARLFGPAKGSIADIAQWAEAKPRLGSVEVIDRGQRHWMPAAEAEVGVEPPFLDERSLEIPATYLVTLRRGRLLLPTGMIVTGDDQVVEQACGWGRRFFPSDLACNSLRPVLRPVRLRGRYATVVSRSGANFYHWFTECLTRLCLWAEIPPVPFVFPAQLTPWQRESLQMVGLAEEQIVELAPGCYEFDELIFPTFPGTVGHLAPPVIRELRRRLVGETMVRPGKWLYVSRQRTAHRRVIEEETLMRRLEDAGFISVIGQEQTLGEKAELFRDAEIVVGAHGAGLTGLLMTAPRAHVVEALDPEHLVSCFYLLAASLNQRYTAVFAENVSTLRGEPVAKGYSDLILPTEAILASIHSSERPTPPASLSTCAT